MKHAATIGNLRARRIGSIAIRSPDASLASARGVMVTAAKNVTPAIHWMGSMTVVERTRRFRR